MLVLFVLFEFCAVFKTDSAIERSVMSFELLNVCNSKTPFVQGIFRPLSNYYPLPFEMKGERYRSVEHYAYEKLFIALKLDDKCVEKIQTTVLPVDVATMAKRYFLKHEVC